VDRLSEVVGWLASPRGNLVWDLLLVSLTVVLIPVLIELWRKRRWLPAKYVLYNRLFLSADNLIHNLVPVRVRMRESSHVWYHFGRSISIGGRDYGKDGAQVRDLETEDFKQSAEELAKRPELLSIIRQSINSVLSRSSAILADEPQLNELVSNLDERLDQAISTLDYYRRGSESMEQVATTFFILAHTAYDLREWLAKQATKVDYDSSG
jgi:hypothetical protein